MDETLKARMKEDMGKMRESCQSVGLTIAAKGFDRIIKRASQNASELTANKAHVLIRECSTRIVDELSDRFFLHIPDDKASFCNEPRELFGKEELERFPTAISEVEEAGKCYALGRNTACVFHLMRTTEIGLRTIAKELSVPFDSNGSWGSLLKQIKDAAEKLHPSDEWTDFYRDIIARLHAVKDAWRNPTMHFDRSYSQDEAKDIFAMVSSFIRHLAVKLKEEIPQSNHTSRK